MDNPFETLLPMAGFVGGLLLWSRIAHIAIALSGLTPNPAEPRSDFEALEAACRQLVLRIAGAWMFIAGAQLVYMLYRGKTAFALLFAGMEAVPLLMVPLFLNTVRRFKRRTIPPQSHTSD